MESGSVSPVDDHRQFLYRVDDDFRITMVSDAWLAFARENNAPALTRDAVIGKRLRNFIAGFETWHLYDMIFNVARRTQKPVVVPFRCDSPVEHRYMELTISSFDEKQFELNSRIVRMEPTAYNPLLDVDTTHGQDWLTICSWCKRVKTGKDRWVESDQAVRDMFLFARRDMPQLTHGMCPRCYATGLDQIAN